MKTKNNLVLDECADCGYVGNYCMYKGKAKVSPKGKIIPFEGYSKIDTDQTYNVDGLVEKACKGDTDFDGDVVSFIGEPLCPICGSKNFGYESKRCRIIV